MKIGNSEISLSSPVYIIAEIGVNHNGDKELAKKSIDAAVEAGADAVKFQTFKSEKLVSKFAVQAKYQIKNTEKEESQLSMLKRLELTLEDYTELKDYCEQRNVEFLSTPFDLDSAIFLKDIGVHAFKIGSGDLTNIPFLKDIAKMNLPTIISTGMASISEIEEAVEVLKEIDVAILHCTSVYPAPIDEVNLLAMVTIKNTFGEIVGYSDHTLGEEVAVGAVVLGAKIIEKHFTLDRDLPGPDHKASLNPEQFKSLVKSIRNVERSLGDGFKRCTPSEVDTKDVARKSLVINKPLKAGDIITENDLEIKRPGTGIPPKYYPLLIGKSVKKSIGEDEVLMWDDVL
jgi:N,N'-diacetyllegionaminate synthase